MKKYLKQLGQGMTEYIIIVALIAIAAIAVYSIFGDVIRGQVGGMAQELAGKEGSTASKSDAAMTDVEKATDKKTLDNFTE
jgi:hypothetical protein